MFNKYAQLNEIVIQGEELQTVNVCILGPTGTGNSLTHTNRLELFQKIR